VPYNPSTAMGKATLANWQKTKMGEWHPDAVDWPKRNSPEWVAIAQKQQAAGLGLPGDPITSMQIHDLRDNAAAMISHHVPHRGGKALLQCPRSDPSRRRLAVSQQSIIQSAAAPPTGAN
jgi:hypothetical protein